ncbi:MAG: VanW family protein, partial [Clostridia bacterium]|nr:VanW family protein [Clostridia bacterium]
MYTNGYAPQQPQEPRKRRTQHTSAQFAEQPVNPAPQPVRNTSSAQEWQQWQQPVQQANRPLQGVPVQGWQQPRQPQQPQQPHGYRSQQQYAGGFAPVAMHHAQQAYQQPQQPQQDFQQQGNFRAAQPSGFRQPAPSQPRQGGGGKPPRRTGRMLAIIAVAVLLVAALSLGGMYYYKYDQTRKYVTPYNAVFCQGVYVDGIHLGGMSAEEGVAAVTEKAQSRNDAWSVSLTYQGQTVTTLTASQLGMTVDVIDVLRQAWEQGHVGDIYQRRADMEQLLITPYQAYTATPGGDTSVVDSVLQQIKNLVYAAPQDARLLSFNPANSYPFEFQNEVYGRVLNTDPIKERIYQMVSTMESGTVEIVPDLIAPTVTVEDLKQNLTMRASVYTPISTSSTTERTNNIRRSFEKISGYILEPGKKMSFNSVVGKRTTDNGFYEAIEYAYGDEVIGVGGGVCQASTTLYQAAVVGGLEIVTREPHSDSVSYAAY